MLIMAVAFSACNQNPPVGPQGPGQGGNDTTQTDTTTTPALPEGVISCAEALAICEETGEISTTEEYTIRGYVTEIVTAYSEQYGNISFWMADTPKEGKVLQAYRVKPVNNADITVKAGDYVEVKGTLVNFKGNTPEVNAGGVYTIVTGEGGGETGGEDDPITGEVTGEGTIDNPYTALDVIALGNSTKDVSGGTFYVKAFIVGQVNGMNMSGFVGNAPFSGDEGKTYHTNIVLANSISETNTSAMVPVQLPSGSLRTGLNLPENPDMFGKEIIIYGSLEGYFGVAGIKNPTYAIVDGKEIGTKPVETTGKELLNETLLTQASFDKFTAVSVSGDQEWTFDAKYGAKMSGFADNATHANEDWFITPTMDLSGKSAATLTFNHAFGPAAQVPTTDATKAQYTIWVSNDFNGDVKNATWTELKGMVYGTTGWGYVSSGEIAIPDANLKANCHIAWKYVCEDVSATWEIKEVIIK